MDEIEKLYNVITSEGLYTKSLEDFNNQFSDNTYKEKVFDVVSEKGLYTKDFDSFTSKYSVYDAGVETPEDTDVVERVDTEVETEPEKKQKKTEVDIHGWMDSEENVFNQTPSELKKTLIAAYPDYQFSTRYETTNPFLTSIGLEKAAAETFDYYKDKETGVRMIDPKSGSTLFIPNLSSYKKEDYNKIVEKAKNKIKSFVEEKGIDEKAYVDRLKKQKDLLEKVDQQTSLTIEEQQEVNNKYKDNSIFKPFEEVQTVQGQIPGASGSIRKKVTVFPYQEDLKLAKELMIEQIAQENLKRSLDNKLPKEPSELEVQNFTRNILMSRDVEEIKDTRFTKYLQDNDEEMQAVLKFYKAAEKTKEIKEIAPLQEIQEAGIEKLNSAEVLGNRVVVEDFEDIYLTPGKNWIADEEEELIELDNGKLAPKSKLDEYVAASNGLRSQKQVLLDRQKLIDSKTDKVKDIDAQFDLLRRDYDNWNKFAYNVTTGFTSIGAGLAYGVGKAVQGFTYMSEMDNDHSMSSGVGEFLDKKALEFTEFKEKTKDKLAKDVSFKNAFSSASSFGNFVAQEMGQQLPILATIIASGGTASPYVIGGYASGEKYMEMDVEDIKSGKERSELEKFGVSAGYGLAESVFERLTTVEILKRGKNYLRNAKDGRVLFKDMNEAIKQQFKEQGKRVFVSEPALESFGEGMTQMTQNLLDGKPIMDNVDHAMFTGGMMGVGMSASPVMYGMAIAKFQDPNLYKEYNSNISEIAKINVKLDSDNLTNNTRSILRKQRRKLSEKAEENLMDIEKLTINSMSPKSFEKYNEISVKQEELRNEAEKVINNDQLSKKDKQEELKRLQTEFSNIQNSRDIYRSHKSFGNKFVLLRSGTEQDQARYQELNQEAIDNIRIKKNEAADFVPDSKEVNQEAYNLFLRDQIIDRVDQANKSKGVNIKLVKKNKDALELVNESNLSDKDKKELIDGIKDGSLNGVDNIEGSSYVFMQNAISNERSSTSVHEPGHEVFKQILDTDAGSFKFLQEEVTNWLAKNDRDMLSVIYNNMTKSGNQMLQSEEFVMEFLEQIDQGNINFDKTANKQLASLFGFMSSKAMKENGFDLDLKGQEDAVSFLINLAGKIKTGTLTEQDIVEARESKVIQKVKEDTNEAIIKNVLKEVGIKKSMSETTEERKSRQDNRNKLLDKVYNEQALDEDGKPVSKQEFSEFLETREGKDFVAEVLMMSYNDMLAIVKGDELKVDFNPIIKHIEAFNPQKKVTEGKFDLKGYFGRFLKVKTQTGSKQVAKTDAPKGTIRIDQKREGARDIDIKDTSKTPDIDTKAELNFRNKLKIKTGGDLYNSILKKAKIILSTLSTNLTVPKTNITLKEVKAKLQENPNNNKAIGNLNKIFKDFRKTLKNAFDTQLFKEIKDSMGTREAYNEYLRSNKEAILTGLPIADLVAMQKAKGADKILVKPIKENLSPNEIKKYEGSEDLMYTSPTSGPTVYERLNPSDKEFVDFFNVRGRKDALARNIAGKLGEDATMETLASEDVMDAFLTKNPTLKQIPTDMLSNSIAQAIDSGISLKFSSNAQKEVFKEYGNDFVENLKEQNLGVNRKSIEAALYKTFINENPTKVWGETIEDQQKTLSKFAKDLVNPVKKYLKPEGKRSLKALKAVPDFGEFTLEEIAQKELDTNLIKILDLKKDGVKSLAEESEAPGNVTLMRELEADFVNYLVDKYGKVKAVKIALTMLKGHNATSAKIGATNLGALSELNEKGKKRQPRYQYFEGLEDFVNSTLKTIPGVEIKIGKTKGDSPKAFIESIVVDKKPIEPFGSRESQTSKSKEHFEETYDKRKKESQEAWDVLTEYLDFMHKNGNNLTFALTMMALKSNMDTILKSSALAKYYYVGPRMSPSKLRYEHMIPTEYVALKLTQHFVGEKIDLQALKDKYNVAIIPKTMDENINVQLQKSMPSFWNETLSETERYFNDLMLGYQNMYALEVVGGKNKGEIIGENFLELNDEVIKAKNFNIETLSNEVIKFKKSESNSDVISYAKTVDEALAIARNPNAPVKKIRVFDFDDTLATTKSDVLFTTPDGTKGKLNAEEFAKQGSKLLEEGYVFDFSEFNKVTDGKPGPLLDIAKKIQEARGTEDVFVLTARAPEAQVAIKEFLDSVGLNIPIENITGLGNSTGAAKANWIVNKAVDGYNDFYFADDAYQNVKAVQDALSQLDVKSKVQQAKVKFSKTVNEDFNKIIEQKTGIASEKVYSKAKAKVRGAGKGNKKFFIPYSAEDFMGLIYPLLSKGKLGDSQMAWFKQNLLDPYARAVENLSTDRLQLMEDFKALKKALEVPKNLRKQNDTGFTNEQAVRVYLFNKMGYDTPGLSKTDLQDLINIVNSDGLLKAFADQLMNLTKGDGYAKPGQSWLAGTITTDLIDVLNTVKRKKYLEQSGFLENADLIFSEENLNKLEAAYGEKYRESMENILKRMKSGKNRLFSGNRLSNRVLDYVNGSIGTIMFLNARSAVLQTISSINFINWSFNNPIKAGKAFANQKQYWKDFMDLMNSDYLMDRRNGLKLNISESEIADAASTSKNKAKAAINYILQKGFAPTQIADSFAIASGGATFYRNRINDLIKNEGLTEAEAKEKAMLEFRQIAETSQQSSDPSKISAQQASDLGRVVLAFANTPMQYARLQKRAAQDLINGRGDAKSHVSKIIYYGVVQNIIFNALQQSLFALGFGDDEDEMTAKELEAHEKDKNKRYYKIANGMLDSQLRGLGVAGATTSVIKNFLLDIYERSDRKRPEYVDAVYKLLQISPPISSKISKVRQAAYQFDSKKRREEIFEKGFSLDNPAYEAGAKVLSATTNIPLDRVYNKINNIEAALAEDTETWQSVAMLAGWPEWQIRPDKKKVKTTSSSKPAESKKQTYDSSVKVSF